MRLASRSLDTPLPGSDRDALAFHCFWCAPCRACRVQFRLLRRWLREPTLSEAADAPCALPPPAAQRLKTALRRAPGFTS